MIVLLVSNGKETDVISFILETLPDLSTIFADFISYTPIIENPLVSHD